MENVSERIIIFMPEIGVGGVEKNLFIVSNYLSNRLKNLSVITISNNYKKKFNYKINLITPKVNWWINSPRRIKYFICLYLLFKEFIKNRKLLIFCFQANIYCTIICRILGIKILVRCNSSPSGWSQNFIKQFIYKNVLNLADKIMVNSLEFKKELFNKFNLKAQCIYNPLNIKEIKRLAQKKIRENFFRRNHLKILNIGRFEDQKDHLTILKSINLLKKKIKIRVIIIGNGKNKKKIDDYIKNNNLHKIVKIKNFVNNPYPYLKKTDIFVLSSLYEGLPNVLLEALALDKFVISSNCPTGPSEILDNNKGGLLFEVSNYRELSEKIMFFLTNKQLCFNKIKHAKKRLCRFDYDLNLKKYYKFVTD